MQIAMLHPHWLTVFLYTGCNIISLQNLESFSNRCQNAAMILSLSFFVKKNYANKFFFLILT